MKKLYSIIAAVLVAAGVFAQAPEKMSYQAVIRDANSNLVTNHEVGMVVSILQGSGWTLVYKEIHIPNPQTNENGLVTIEIGGGIPVTGIFAEINWADGPYFIKTETDPEGGTNYSISGISQLLSVPYALFAKNAQNVTRHYIGEQYGGGIVFCVYDNGQHGLIASTADQATGIGWYGGYYTNTGARGDGVGAGLKNTAIIIANQGSVEDYSFAARVCNEYSYTDGEVIYGDWYLPSKYELNLLYLQRYVVGGFSTYGYWSSTEYDYYSAWLQSFDNGTQFYYDKYYYYMVRAIRAF